VRELAELPRRQNGEYDEPPPGEWSEGLVGFKPAPVFDVPQTEGEPLPELETEATGDGEGLVPALRDTADDLGVIVETVDAAEWEHSDAKRSVNIGVETTTALSLRRKPARIRSTSQ